MRIYRAPEVWNVPVPHGGRCGTALKIPKRWGRRPRRPAPQILHSPLELTMDGTIKPPPVAPHTVARRLEIFNMIRSEDRQALNPRAESEDRNGQSPSPRGHGETLQAQGDRYREQRKDMNLKAGSPRPAAGVGVMPGREKRVARKQRDQHPHDIGTVTLPELMHSADRDC